MQTKKISIELTEDEAKVVSDYLFRKACKLEDANLTDSYCYPRLYSAYHKINRAMGDDKDGNGTNWFIRSKKVF